MSEAVTIARAEALALCIEAARRAGASADAAGVLARASVDAEARGQRNVGMAHFLDYLDAMAQGRIRGTAEPVLTKPAPAIILSDAAGGTAHLGFDRAVEDLAAAARACGVAVFAQRNAYTCGALGWFAGSLAARGLVAIAATSGPALMAGSGTTKPVFCTNPLAFAAPRDKGPPLLIDQASSATAFVNIRAAAARGETIPPGWAIDPNGAPTTDPRQAMKGALLAFGGSKGANIGLMVEVLAAGLGGASWSLDAPSFTEGERNPDSGLFVLALAPGLFDPDFARRLDDHLHRLETDFGLHVPGSTAAFAPARTLSVSTRTLDRIRLRATE